MLSDTEFNCAECPNGMRGNGIHCSTINEVCSCHSKGMTITLFLWFNCFFSVRRPILVHI